MGRALGDVRESRKSKLKQKSSLDTNSEAYRCEQNKRLASQWQQQQLRRRVGKRVAPEKAVLVTPGEELLNALSAPLEESHPSTNKGTTDLPSTPVEDLELRMNASAALTEEKRKLIAEILSGR
eukprot:Lankesteria_metandrocarpae@DN2384_c0_g1_i1.p2